MSDHAIQHMIAMRDGVRLATDVYLSRQSEAPAPAILIRLPYDKNSRYVFMEQVARRFSDAGYVTVVQDVRGKFRSEGDQLGPSNEVNDGYDTIDWVSKQTWCNGDVGMFGDSYYGFTQWAALSSAHPALKAMVPRVTSTDIGALVRETKGPVSDVPWLTAVKYVAQCWTGPFIAEDPIDWEITPLTEAFEAFFQRRGERAPWYDLMVPRQVPVKVYSNGHPYNARPVPTLHCVGWFDNLLISHMRDYMQFAGSAAGPLHYLLADSVDHENYHLDDVPVQAERDHDQDEAALNKLLDVYLDPAIEFFDVFIRQTLPVSSIPKVRWHLGGAGPREAETWPPPNTAKRELYLTPGKDSPASRAALSWVRPEYEASWTWNYDPDNMVRSTVENSFAQVFEYPDEAIWLSHSDVLAFDSDVLEEPIDIAGPVDLLARVSTSAPSADLHAKLCDVAPDGRVSMIVRGQACLLNPDIDGLVRIEMGHIGYRVRAGHRLQLQISSSDYPEFAPNSGTDENRWLAAQRRGSQQRLTTDDVSPSHVSLSILSGEPVAS